MPRPHPSSLILLFACALLLTLTSAAFADWPYRVAISLTNSGAKTANYVVRLNMGAAQQAMFDSSESDGSDWRFQHSKMDSFCAQWFQLIANAPDTAIVLVRVDTLYAGANIIYWYLGNAEAELRSDGAATVPLFQDFNTDFTVSGVTDILHMQGLGIDSCRRIVMDTSAAEDQWQRFEESNVFCLSDPALYLHLYSARDSGQSTGDFSYTYQETSPDGFIWTRKGRIDTIGGGTPDTNARGEDSYIIQWQDTLWEYCEDKRFSRVPPGYVDACGMWYSSNRGGSWIPYGLIDGVNEPNNWLYNHQTECASPAAIVVGDTIWLMLEGPAGARHIGCFWSLHPKGPWHLRKIFYNNTVQGGYWYLTGVPDQLFSINDTIYMDTHCRVAATANPTWRHTRYRIGANFDTLLDTRIFSPDSMIMGAGEIISQDILGDCTWISWAIAPYGGYDLNQWRNVRRRTAFTDPTAVPDGWSGFRKFSTFGFNEARNGVLTLAAEPWREDSNNSAIALRSDIGFVSGFVLEYRQRLKWDTLEAFAVVSFGSSDPAPVEELPLYSYRMATDSGYLIQYGSGSNGCMIARKAPDSTRTGYSSFTVPDSLLNTWRVHHLAFGSNDTLRFWMDGLASSSAHKSKDATFNMNAKRILFASGEAKNKTYVPRGSQMRMDWVLVRPYQFPEPTSAYGPIENADSNYVYFNLGDTVIVADADARIDSTAPTRNRGKIDTLVAGNATNKATYAFSHWDLSWLPAQSAETTVTVTSALCSLYASGYQGSGATINLFRINHDWFEGDSAGATGGGTGIDYGAAACWNWRGWSEGGVKSVCGNTIAQTSDSLWPGVRIGTTPYDTVTFNSAPIWAVFDNIVPLVQSLVDSGKAKAYGCAAARPQANETVYARFHSREKPAATQPRLRVAGYYRTLIVPDLVASVTATDNLCDRVLVTWANVADEDSFQVRRDGSRIGMTLTDVLSYSDMTAVLGVSYLYTVAAYNVDSCYTPTVSDYGQRRCGASDYTGPYNSSPYARRAYNLLPHSRPPYR